MRAFGYLFITAAALAFLVILVTTGVWYLKKIMSDQDKENRISSIGLLLNILFTGLILVVTIFIYSSLSPSDYIDALLTASPLLISVIFLAATFFITRRTFRHINK